MNRSSAHAKGFSLVELMVAITVAAVLMVYAVPNLRNAIRRNNVSSGSNTLLAAVSYARAEAISRSVHVSICPSTDGASCSATSTDYAAGWLIYAYTPGNSKANTTYDSTSSNNVILRRGGTIKGVAITAKDAKVISFDQQGQLTSGTTSKPAFLTCYLDSSTPTSTAAVPGAELDLNGSGSITSKPVAAGGSCTPS